MPRRLARGTGFTLMELLMASIISSVIAGGTMASFVAAARMVRDQNIPSNAEASNYAEDTIERYRNLVAYNDATFANWVTTNAGPAWHADPLPGSGPAGSILSVAHRRCFRVTPTNCDGVGPADDCFAVDVRVCWSDLSQCPC